MAIVVGTAVAVGESEVAVADSACGLAVPDDETIGPQATATDRMSASARQLIAMSLERGYLRATVMARTRAAPKLDSCPSTAPRSFTSLISRASR